MVEGKHTLVTGGAGFIGSHLVERLLAEAKPVVVIDDLSTGSLENLRLVENHRLLQIVVSTVSGCADLRALVAGAESVYHLAGAVGVQRVLDSPLTAIQTNLCETQAVLAAAAESQVPLLLTSSSEVYGKSQKEAFSEQDDLLIGPSSRPRWGYACSKLMDEFLALAYGREKELPVVVARLFNTVGPRQTGRYGMVLPRFIAAATAGRPLEVYGDGTQKRCFCYVTEVVDSLLLLQNCPAARGEVFNVGGTEETSIEQLAQLIVSALGSRSEIRHLPYSEVHSGDFEDMQRRRPDVSKLDSVTHFVPGLPLKRIIELTANASE
jgi:UDP-glucose 4-epimerase